MSTTSLKCLLCSEKGDGVLLRVYVQPRSSCSQMDGIREGNLKISLTAPPAAGKANQQLISFLSDLLKVKKSAIKILRGQKSRTKKIIISGLTCEELLNKLSLQLNE